MENNLEKPTKPADDPDGTFSTVILSSTDATSSPQQQQICITQSAPNTPIQHREMAAAEFPGTNLGPQPETATILANKPNLGIGNLRDGIFACFRPVWGYFGRGMQEITKPPPVDTWEVPFEEIGELEWLGSGSQGAVFRGQYRDKLVAVKKVNHLKDTDIKHLRHLRHKNIIEFIGVCSKSPCYCIIMEYCSKGQLCQVLKKYTIDRLNWSKWIREIADGMHYLHDNKVIHRDLKSPNILISDDDSIKICDFGTSHLQCKSDSTMMSFCGTVSWMAPEMLKKEPCSEKVDVYSFGVVLWEMLTREQPYANIDQMAVIYGVGTNILSLPLPETAPKGIILLIKQCLSLKGRNRPSFSHIRQHLEIFKSELLNISDAEWQQKCQEWNDFAKRIQYPSTIKKKHGENGGGGEEEHHRKRIEQLSHIRDIRMMYEQKLKRANKMYDKLQGCFNELKLKENELDERERDLEERELHHTFTTSPRSSAHRMRSGSCGFRPYDNPIDFDNDPNQYSSDDERLEYCRNSPYRCSQGSSSSGVQFSRQSSCRSSAGAQTRRSEGYHPQKLFPNDNRQSAGYWESVRNSPARVSGLSQDSGIGGGSCTGLNNGQPATYSQTIYRNCDGRWSDGRIASRRRTPAASSSASRVATTTFQRDSPMRQPHGAVLFYTPRSSSNRHPNRASYPSRISAEDCCQNACCRQARAKSIAAPSTRPMARSPTPYDNPAEQPYLPEFTSYDEALKAQMETEGSPMRFVENPIYTSPVTTYSNPLREVSTTKSEQNHQDEEEEEENANDIDLTSSMDSRRSRADDADIESSEEEEQNGNMLNESINSRSSEMYSMNTSTMMSSLERSLELGATRSDGLSDNERRVQAVKKSIKGHRRTHSNPQAIIHQIIDESLSSSMGEDSDEAAAVEI
ncbi:unnamed protein product [Caenorhabditis angaria]|uniref:Mitogen-activated protein kinase kinase kinase n=1 Tax=Caenorhabditis angaria TaxID=860376 RepID=A0A9P1I7L7_9PELO|nr:unnamed protein product [Caenorhabditis angaria]